MGMHHPGTGLHGGLPVKTGKAVRALTTLVALFVLASLFVFSPIAPFGGHDASAAGLSSRLQDTRAQLERVRKNLAKAEDARKAALGDIAALDQNIERAEDEVNIATAAYEKAADKLAGLQEELAAVTADLKKKQGELARAEADLQKQQEVFNKRLVSVYKSGRGSAYLEALIEPGSISEMLGRFDLLSTIADRDSIILTQIVEFRAKVEKQKMALEKERARVAALERSQRATTETLEAQADKKQAAVDQLENAKAAKEEVLAAAERDVVAWGKQEDALSAESDRIAGQLRAAQEARGAERTQTTRAASSRTQTASVDDDSGGGSGRFYRPVPGAISSHFGYRMHPIFHVRKMHTGVDMRGGMGVPIHAAESGTVVSAGWRGGYGKCIIISHGGGLSTLYAHLSTFRVSTGDVVKRGQVIGGMGSTGYSTGPHLHFEVRVGGSPVNPAGYL